MHAMQMKTRDFALLIKQVGVTGEFEGYASVFGVRDFYNEVVMPGAFVESLARHKRSGTRPLMLWQHDPHEPLGVWDDLAEDGKGLWVKGTLLKGVRRADEAHIMLKAGAVQGLSIGYREIDTEPAANGDARKLVKLDLVEVSIVSMPANPRARVEAVKAEEVQTKMQDFARRVRDGDKPAIKEFEDILRDAGIPKALAVQIASRGYASIVRSDSDEHEAAAKRIVGAVGDAVAALKSL